MKETMPVTATTPYPETLRAMSIHFPFAWAIVHGKKDFEYRTKATKYRGIFLIHASSSKDSDEFMAHYDIPQDQIVRKAIIGAAELVDCVEDDKGDGYYYELINPITFEKPIPVADQQSIFWPASTPERDRAFKQAWKLVQETLSSTEPTALFKISQELGLIRISSQKTETTFLVKDEGLWDYLVPYIQNGTIEFSKTELENLYKERIQP